ncbi:Secreted protein containing C-terminal beta-propeller domain [Thermosyntropha lipolytica DSM 11003]|uniref:Secreted protein containing C-terminal beta-propeller domain n=2 Tax=Thermosyntropha TaxID=54293 RepID=A0A1M5RBY5_9FIRM|nr:Secreted protein containing C-terminal beta-propeller domain [Thermosyntropha lipolytica DSM 11003]
MKLKFPRWPLLIISLILVLASSQVLCGQTKASFIEKDLPRVGSMDNMVKLLEKHAYSMPVRALKDAEGGQAKTSLPESTNQSSSDYSSTNIQVRGVDEADIVKTDGNYIYYVKNDAIDIIKAVPAPDMQLISRIKFDDPNFYPSEIYLEKNYLVVLGTSNNLPHHHIMPVPYARTQIYPPPFSTVTTKVIIYNVQEPKHPQKIREVEVKGYLLSSRKIKNAVYLVANHHFYWYQGIKEVELPAYRDTNNQSSRDFQEIPCANIRYFPDNISSSYLVLVGFNLDDMVNTAAVEAYLGYSENIYASPQNLYIALTREPVYRIMSDANTAKPEEEEGKTLIYKFNLKQGKTLYAGKAEVKGRILNQFSMDEYEDNFRIATTSGDIWRDDEYTSKNNIYILDKDLKLIGKLEGIAPKERIYSTRFMGDRAYMVTFRNVDPFFVIDLKNPEKPQILGLLKIPGYSDYLHPYDENHIIGFGKDTVEIKGQAFYQGMKIALFDVSDVNNPVEKSKVIIGDRGTESELLNNHKALLFSKEKNILAFPVTVMKLKPGQKTDPTTGIPAYGSFSFQGAYIYSIDLKTGFKLKGTITHLEKEDYLKAGDYWYESDKNIKRVIYIGDTLYTISPSIIKAYNMQNLSLIQSLNIK